MRGVLLVLFANAFSANLFQERIWKIPRKKSNSYVSSGIFTKQNGGRSTLKNIRQFYSKNTRKERIVLDFKGKVPKLYAFFEGRKNMLHIDMFDTKLRESIAAYGNGQFVKGLEFYPIESNVLTLTVTFKEKRDLEVFYLSGPGRVVIDVR